MSQFELEDLEMNEAEEQIIKVIKVTIHVHMFATRHPRNACTKIK